MASYEQNLASVVAHLALSYDGAVLGVALAYAAVRSIIRFTSTSKALTRIRSAPSVSVAGLRSLLDAQPEPSDHTQSQDHDFSQSQRLVFVRGHVEPKSAVKVFAVHKAGDKAVIVQRTQSFMYSEWSSLFGLTYDLRGIFRRSWREQGSSPPLKVPFVLAQDGQQSNFIVVNIDDIDGSRHPLPLVTVDRKLQPYASPLTFLQAIFVHNYPIGILTEEKILPIGKDISAVGTCGYKNGVPEIRSCKDLPYFLSDMTKDEMVADLTVRTKVLFWSGVVLGSISVGILGYAIKRNWSKWKEWRRQRQQEPSQANGAGDVNPIDLDDDDDNNGNVPDEQLCVICLMRRRRAAFIPCGHLVCCHRCAVSVEGQVSPKCPLCRQCVRNSIRIFDS